MNPMDCTWFNKWVTRNLKWINLSYFRAELFDIIVYPKSLEKRAFDFMAFEHKLII